jgi:peptide-methionine (S)-S-oxide reductase
MPTPTKSRNKRKRSSFMLRSLLSSTVLAIAFLAAPGVNAADETAIIAGGCFWCVESDMDKVKGVKATVSGYAGGTKKSPTYENHEGYTEAVKVTFDNSVITYDALVAHFLRTIDVTDGGGQFCDRGESYIPALFPVNKKQKKAAEAALKQVEKDLGQPHALLLSDNPTFADAEDYHQNYYLGQNRVLSRFGLVKQADAYKGYRKGCGRDARVKEVWGDKAHTFPAGGNS